MICRVLRRLPKFVESLRRDIEPYCVQLPTVVISN
jgi:hypothetical protein